MVKDTVNLGLIKLADSGSFLESRHSELRSFWKGFKFWMLSGAFLIHRRMSKCQQELEFRSQSQLSWMTLRGSRFQWRKSLWSWWKQGRLAWLGAGWGVQGLEEELWGRMWLSSRALAYRHAACPYLYVDSYL